MENGKSCVNLSTTFSGLANVCKSIHVCLTANMDKSVQVGETLDKSIQGMFDSQRGYETSKGMGVGKYLIKKFLNSDWKEWEIQEALAQLDDDRVTPAAMVHLILSRFAPL